CSTHGRTPPCTDRILKYPWIKTLAVFNRDPLLSGEGIRRLKKNGKKIFERNIYYNQKAVDPFLGGFLLRTSGRGPRFHLKAAVFSDGIMGSRDSRVLISGNESLRFGMALRAKLDAVLVGPGTIHVDLPSLHLRECSDLQNPDWELLSGTDLFSEALLGNLREIEMKNYKDLDYQPDRVMILDEKFDQFEAFYEKQMNLEKTTGRKSVFFVTEKSKQTWKKIQYDAVIPDFGDPAQGEVLRRHLADRGYNEVLIEGGAGLFESILPSLDKEDRIYILKSRKYFSGDPENAVYLPKKMFRSPFFRCRLGEDELSVS
ncbi:MAG: hypothetical protein OEZ34_03170, partial [Spirochaetia bacterium]|nr:hypothetical protein [Spirochaetia bacterium]